jgi:hypothetical protein
MEAKGNPFIKLVVEIEQQNEKSNFIQVAQE